MKLGGDTRIIMIPQSWLDVIGQKLRKGLNISFLWHACSVFSNNTTREWFDSSSQPPSPSKVLWVLLGDWVLVRKVSDGGEDEGLRFWGIK